MAEPFFLDDDHTAKLTFLSVFFTPLPTTNYIGALVGHLPLSSPLGS